MSKKLTPCAIDFINCIIDEIDYSKMPDDDALFEIEFWKLYPNIPHEELKLESTDWKGIYICAHNCLIELGIQTNLLTGIFIPSVDRHNAIKEELHNILKLHI